MMELKLIEEKEKWDGFLKENAGSFLQSFDWGRFQEGNSKKIFRMALTESGKIFLQAQIIENRLPFGKYFYIPYGPVFNKENSSEENIRLFLSFIKESKELAEKEKAIFLKIEPIFDLPEAPGSRFCRERVQPRKTLILDLAEPEEMLRNLKKNTRYNINLAQKKGVEIRMLDSYSDVFYRLLRKTRERQGFHSYPENYYKKMFDFATDDFQVKLFLAEHSGNPVAATIAIFFGNRATSLHTGFDYKYRELKAPYLLRWRIILEAQKKGLKEYDFWGIDEKKWPGVTALKKSFGGREEEYGQGREIIFDKKWYIFYRILKAILR